ncbi:MAG: response regulator [Proteobacteria bacterium]|nr:response regulator [Pseudomonadota bacterium]
MKKILIVDDHSDIRKLIRITIGNSYEVLEAEDGMTALQIIRHHQPALAVLDIMMPGEMDGLQVLDAIRADPALKDMQVIMVTARGQAKDYEAGMSRGANAYLIKPFSPIHLVNSIKELLK